MNYTQKDNCGCGTPNLSHLPPGTKVIIEQPSPGLIILKSFLCFAIFVSITWTGKLLGLPILYSAIFGVILALCCGGCLSFLIRKLDSLMKIH